MATLLCVLKIQIENASCHVIDRDVTVCGDFLVLLSLSPDGIRTTIPVGEECVINVNAAEAGFLRRLTSSTRRWILL